jgi:hypothetical protein
MSGTDEPTDQTAPVPTGTGATSLVVRSQVAAGRPYTEYKQFLRNDFFRSCAYCTVSEAEAKAINFTIDHYEAQSSRADLVNDYSNLMYCCQTCNTYKGPRHPPPEARADGNRFFRPDQDLRKEHFERDDRQLKHKTTVGHFTIVALHLNRKPLMRLRELRTRLTECDRYVIDGIMALRGYPMDSLPSDIRSIANKRIKEAMVVAVELADEIDALLREYAGSPMVDPDEEDADKAAIRARHIKELEGMYPGKRWRAPRASRNNKRKKR